MALSRSFSNIADGLRLAYAHTLAVAGVPGVLDTSPPSSPRVLSFKRGTRASFHGRGIPRLDDRPSLYSPIHALPRSCPHSPSLPQPHRSLPIISSTTLEKSYLDKPCTLYEPPHDQILSVRALIENMASIAPRVVLAALSPRPSPRNLPRPPLYRSTLSRSNPNVSSPSSCSSSLTSSNSQLEVQGTAQTFTTDEDDRITDSRWDMISSSYSLHRHQLSDPFPLLAVLSEKVGCLQRPLPIPATKTPISSLYKTPPIQSRSYEPLSSLQLAKMSDKLYENDDSIEFVKPDHPNLLFRHQDRHNSYRHLDHQDDSPPPRRKLTSSVSFNSENPAIIHRHQMCPRPLSESYLDESDGFPKSQSSCFRENLPSPPPSLNLSSCSLPVHSSTNHNINMQRNHNYRQNTHPNHYCHLRYLHQHHNMFPSVSSLKLFSSSSGLFPGALEWDFDSSSGGEGVGGEIFNRAGPPSYGTNSLAPSTPTQLPSPKSPPSTPTSRIGCDPSNPVLSLSLSAFP